MNIQDDDEIIRDIDRKTLVWISSGFHFREDESKEFTRMFGEYKNHITEIKSRANTEGEAWLLLKSMMTHNDFITEGPILTRQEYGIRLGNMLELVEKYYKP